MAPSRMAGKAAKPSGSRTGKAGVPGRSLFFGGTEHIQEDGMFPISKISCHDVVSRKIPVTAPSTCRWDPADKRQPRKPSRMKMRTSTTTRMGTRKRRRRTKTRSRMSRSRAMSTTPTLTKMKMTI